MSKTKKVPLGEVCEIIMGQSPPSEYYNKKKEGLPFFQGKTDFNELYPTITTYCTKPQKIAEKNDILISVRAPVGPTNIATTKSCIGRGLAAIRAKEIESKYTLYFLRFNEISLASKGKGSTFEAINREDLESLEIPLPPHDIQQQIAARLEKADEIRRMRRYAIEMSERFLQEVFIDMFGDPVKNPKGWDESYLKDLCIKIIDCRHYTPEYSKTGIPLIRTNDLTPGFFNFIDTKFVSESEYLKLIENNIPTNSDIVFAREGSLGVASYINSMRKYAIGQRTMILRTDPDKLNPIFLTYLINSKSFSSKIKKISLGTTVLRVNVLDVKELIVIRPNIKEQNRFSQIAFKMNKNIEASNEALRQSELLFSSLLNEAFKE